MALLILHTIGASLHLSHCRIEIALLIKDPPHAHLPGEKKERFRPSFSSHFNLKSCTFFHILLFSIIPAFMDLSDYNTLSSVSDRVPERHMANW